MATVPLPSAGSRHRLPKLPQFGMRSLLIGVALCGGLFAVMTALGLLGSVVLGWFLLLAAAHVAANAWGTRLHGRRVKGPPRATADTAETPSDTITFAPCTRLRGTILLGRTIFIATVAGALVGGTLGTYLLCLVNWGRVGVAGIAVGGFSSAVIGGFIAFLASSFFEVASQAFGEARRGAEKQVGK